MPKVVYVSHPLRGKEVTGEEIAREGGKAEATE
jgi:hypothetical protein